MTRPAFVIEKGIPIPPRPSARNGRYTGLGETLKACEIGDSVLLDTPEAAANMQTFMRERHRMTFTRRRVADGWRVWRVA